MQVLQDSFPCINHLPKELQSNFKKQKKFKRKKKKSYAYKIVFITQAPQSIRKIKPETGKGELMLSRTDNFSIINSASFFCL